MHFLGFSLFFSIFGFFFLKIYQKHGSKIGYQQLAFKFNSEADKLVILHGGPYLVFGRPLVLKAMPEFFDFTLADMSTVLI
jgi:hypothetical protein